MVVPRLPLELIDAIAGAVEELKRWEIEKTLRAMAGVCRAWLSVMTPRLWRDVTMECGSILAFRQLVQENRGKAIAQSVKKLVLWSLTPSDCAEYPVDTLTMLLDLLPNLQSLSIEELWFRADDELKPPHHNGRKIKEVVIFCPGSSDDHLIHLVAFLNIFDVIDTLAFHDPDFADYFVSETPDPRLQVRTALDALGDLLLVRTTVRALEVGSLSYSGGVAILELMRRNPNVRKLESIRMDCEELDEFTMLCDLLHDAGNGVLDLTLDISGDVDGEAEQSFRSWQESEVKVAACTSLRSLTLNIDVADHPVDDTQISHWSRAVSFLSYIPPHQLTSVHFVLSGHVRYSMQELRASEGRMKLASVLSKVPNLQSVLLTMAFEDYATVYESGERKLLRFVEEMFVKVLPKIAERGLLRVREDRSGSFRVLGCQDGTS